MGDIFTRKALNEIMGNEALTPEQRTEQVFGLYGRALDDGYIAKRAAQQAQQTALDNARTEWEKGVKVPDPKESDAYKQLAGDTTISTPGYFSANVSNFSMQSAVISSSLSMK